MSIRTRLLTGLLVSLTFVLAAGCVALYASYRQTLYVEFDRQLARDAYHGFRLLRAGRPRDDQEPPALPAGLMFTALLDAETGEVKRTAPAESAIDGPALLGEGVPPGEPAYRTHSSDDGELRLMLVHINRPRFGRPPSQRQHWQRWPGRQNLRRPDHNPTTQPTTGPDSERRQRFAGWRQRLVRPDTPPPGEEPPPPDADEPTGRPPEARIEMEEVMVAAADLTPLHAALRRWMLILIAGGTLGELLVVGVVFVAVTRGLRPLRRLEGEIARIDDSHLRHRVPDDGLPGEVRPIVGRLNELLERLDAAFERERAFTASAAHEFRTPLAGLRAQIEVALMRPRSDAEYQATLEKCLAGAIALQQMVDSLLSLASFDAGLTRPRARAVDVAEALREQSARAKELADARGCSLTVDAPDAAQFRVDPVLFEHIVSNLLTNAAEHGDADGAIRAKLAVENGHLDLSVTNPAGSLTQNDLPKMFDRFWRKDESRTDTGQHFGLGMAIVARSVDILDGTIDTRLGGGELEINVRLPAMDGQTRGTAD